MTDALRSPGSALKPFIYGLAFEDGIAHPETLIEDRPVRYGAYAPENFDLTFQGTVTARRALQLSLNVPAVALLDGVGASRLNARISPGRRHTGAAEGRGAGARNGARRPRHQAVRPDDALRRPCARRQCRAAHQSASPDARLKRRAGCSIRSRPGTSATSWSARRRRRTPPAAASRTRPARPTAIATPGRSASTASEPSAYGSAGRTARRSRA